MRERRWILLGLVAVAFLGGAFFFFLGSLFSLLGGAVPTTGEVAVIEVLGGIYDAKPTVEQLKDLREEDGVKAVVLRIDSPGGSIGASQEIFEAVKELRTVKPVVASMGSVAASGGYYVAAPASKILANPGTITGSIGVRMEWVNVEELLKWARLKAVTLKSGALKDVGSTTRPMTAEERAYLEEILKRLHDQFKKAVAESRNIPEEEMETISDGRVLTGEEAVSQRLVDEIGGLERAVKVAGELGGVKGEPEVFYPPKKGRRPWDYLIEGMVDRVFERLFRAPSFFYD